MASLVEHILEPELTERLQFFIARAINAGAEDIDEVTVIRAAVEGFLDGAEPELKGL